MIYDMQTFKVRYKCYSNINQKISQECLKNKYVRIKRGLYSNNIEIDAPVLANICSFPSYLSFEYELSIYGLIPERVTTYTSAFFNKKNYKRFSTSGITFEYRSIPNDVFSQGIDYQTNDEGVKYKIACPEKALCDLLYTKYSVRTIKDLKMMLFDDLRIDEDEFHKLDYNFILSIGIYYHSNTINTLVRFLKKKDK